MKFSLANIWGLRSNFIDCESFHNSNFPDILVLYETNLDDSIDSGNFSVRGYLPLIQKDSGNIFYKYQSGFRNNHSTDLFLSFLNDKILKGFGNAMYTGMILIDLQKAFDLINHKILFDKLLPTGFSKNTISWYESYLAELHFTVKVVNRASEFANTSAMFNFRSSTVSDLCQWCEPSCRIWLAPICTWFMPAIPS